MTRRELMQRMGSDELCEWVAFERIHPFEDGYWQAAQIAFTVARSQNAKGIRFDDFLPRKTQSASRGVPRVPGKIVVGAGVLPRIQKHKAKLGHVVD